MSLTNSNSPMSQSQFLLSVAAWANGLPSTAWTPGVPPQVDSIFSVRTKQGTILTGHSSRFQGRDWEAINKRESYRGIEAHTICELSAQA